MDPQNNISIIYLTFAGTMTDYNKHVDAPDIFANGIGPSDYYTPSKLNHSRKWDVEAADRNIQTNLGYTSKPR